MSETSAASTTITFDDFTKVDMRAGRITTAERVPKSELLKLQVDFGDLGTRQVLARIGKDYEPEAIVGLAAAFVVNLAPRTMKGLESHGMILAGEHDSGVAVVFLSGVIRPGTRLG